MMMRIPPVHLAAVLLLAAGTTATAQSLSTGFDGGTTVGGDVWNGLFFDVTALNSNGITITSWDVDCTQVAGTSVDVRVYVKQGSHVGFHTDPSAWTLLGEASTTSAGSGNPTPVPIGDMFINANQSFGIRIGVQPRALRYKNATQTNANPIFSNADLQIDLTNGMSQGTLWGGGITPRGWNGTIHYDIGNTAVAGACCLPDGTCEQLSQSLCGAVQGTFQGAGTECAALPPCPKGACCLVDGTCVEVSEAGCAAQEGTYHGNGTTCGTTPPGGCPQPPTGACCFTDTSCSVETELDCRALQGFFRGDNTDCSNVVCPVSLMTTFAGGNAQAGTMFDLTALDDIVITGFDYLSASSAAPSQQQIEIYFVTDRTTFVGKEENAAAWTLLETVTVERQPSPIGEPNPTRVPISGFAINAGETIGIYFTRNSTMATTSIRYTNGPLGTFSTAELIFEDRGVGKAYPFASTFDPRVWNGVIYYIAGDPPCYADCDVNGELNINDFLCFIDEFAGAQTLPPSQQQTHYVNCTGATAEPYLTVNDFLCFIDKFAQGCP